MLMQKDLCRRGKARVLADAYITHIDDPRPKRVFLCSSLSLYLYLSLSLSLFVTLTLTHKQLDRQVPFLNFEGSFGWGCLQCFEGVVHQA